MPRISVIVPVYNVEEYLALSLQSVRDQDWHDLEIICVNDGSTDGSAEVLRLFERADERITVVEKENGGLSSARNAGIKAASGDIVCFLDSDDLLTENACGTIVRAFDRTGADVVTYGAMAYPEFRSYPWLEEVLSPRDVDYEQFSTDILFKEQSRPFAWRTACRRDFLLESGVLFDETLPFGEDQLFHFAVYPRASNVARRPPEGKLDASGSPFVSSFPEKSIITQPDLSTVRKLSCFSAVMPVIGWNQCVKCVAPLLTAHSFIEAATISATSSSRALPSIIVRFSDWYTVFGSISRIT